MSLTPSLQADTPQEMELENIFGCVCDLNGVLRGKRMPVEVVALPFVSPGFKR